ncbi:hypothetical protein NC651_032389 [Populus alba x Populus x berolinensis]|nr:hypothetical protein NC651_032389 [Populus alba x Populus x berolinensis]
MIKMYTLHLEPIEGMGSIKQAKGWLLPNSV